MGGAEKLITEMVPRLKQLGNDVDVLVFNGKETPFMQRLKEDGVKIIKLGKSSRHPYSLLNLIQLIPLLQKYDIVHSHTTPAQIFTMLGKLLSFSNVKIVTTEHSTNNHRRGKWLYKWFDLFMYNYYNRIICIADISKKNLLKQIGKNDKVTVIENGVDIEHFYKAAPIPRQEIGMSNDDFILIMVGRFVDAKDQETIIRALSLLPERFKLLLVGVGELQGQCEQLAQTLQVSERIKFLGTRIDIPQLLHTANIVIMSSHWEGLSLSSVEGMAVGKPLIASNVEGLREVVGGAGLLFKEGDYKQLAELTMELMFNNDLYQRTATQCLLRARHYDISTMVSRYESIYQSI